MSAVDYTDELEAGWVIFPLYPIIRTADGLRCACERPDCESIGKHPRASNWQHTQPYDEEQLSYLEDFDGDFFGNQLIDNHGIVVASSGLIVVDVDGRNGGFDSAKNLQGIREKARYIVQTGSGAGEHWYFKVPSEWAGKSLSGTLASYPGVDFKSSGFVVGVGCEHASGNRYEAALGSPAEITEAPAELMELLDRPERARFVMNGSTTDYSLDDLRDIVSSIPNTGRDYERWIRVGMGLHDATGGSSDGYGMWHDWSSKSDAHDDRQMDMKWHSFGKSPTRATVGTLIEWARDGGWSASVTFTDNTDWGEIPSEPRPVKRHDLLNPPGFVGEICDWINSRCAYPREHLAVAAALQIVSNAAGLNYLVEGRRTSLNLMTYAIAGSRTGKGAIKECINETMRALGLSGAEHGKFKSSQDLVRNAMQHQIIIYTSDEFGEQLKKIAGAGKSGAHYLVDVIAELIAMQSVATGVHGVSGDVKREIIEECEKRLAREVKKAKLDDDESASDYAKEKPDSGVARAIQDIERAETGIYQPYLTFFGLSEPASFHAAINADSSFMSGGFMGRALIFEELETVPKEKPLSDISFDPMPEHLLLKLMGLSGGGSADAWRGRRIERQGDWKYIKWSAEASKILSGIKSFWYETAIHERNIGSGLESQALGATELTIKVAGILGAADGEISAEHIGWAHELVRGVTMYKINKARSDERLESTDATEKGDGLLDAIMVALENSNVAMTPGRLKQRIPKKHKITDETMMAALAHLIGQGRVSCEHIKSGNGKTFPHYSVA